MKNGTNNARAAERRQILELGQKLKSMVVALPKRGFDPFKRQLADIVALSEHLGVTVDELSAMAVDKQLSVTTLRRISAGKNTHNGVDDEELAAEIVAARTRLAAALHPSQLPLPTPQKPAEAQHANGPRARGASDGSSKRSAHRLHDDPDAVEVWTVDDVAKQLGTTPRQIRNMRSRGMLPPAIKWPGLGVRWMRDEFIAWMRDVGANAERE